MQQVEGVDMGTKKTAKIGSGDCGKKSKTNGEKSPKNQVVISVGGCFYQI